MQISALRRTLRAHEFAASPRVRLHVDHGLVLFDLIDFSAHRDIRNALGDDLNDNAGTRIFEPLRCLRPSDRLAAILAGSKTRIGTAAEGFRSLHVVYAVFTESRAR